MKIVKIEHNTVGQLLWTRDAWGWFCLHISMHLSILIRCPHIDPWWFTKTTHFYRVGFPKKPTFGNQQNQTDHHSNCFGKWRQKWAKAMDAVLNMFRLTFWGCIVDRGFVQMSSDLKININHFRQTNKYCSLILRPFFFIYLVCCGDGDANVGCHRCWHFLFPNPR